MQTLAALFVSLVTFANTLAPQAQLPKVLGVQIAEAGTESAVETPEPTASPRTSTTSGELKKEREQARNDFKNMLKNIRIDKETAAKELQLRRKEAIDTYKEEREQFKVKLETIKDQKKKVIVEKLDAGLSERNKNWVDHWTNVLTKLSDILARIKSRADKAQAAGHDIGSVNAAIQAAEDAITSAQTAINNQASKDYVVNISTEKNLGQGVKTTLSQFKTDTKAVLEKVTAAREAVKKALLALVAVKGVDDDLGPTSTPAGTIEPTATATPGGTSE